jgi:SpoIID/LytB domain protein
MPSVWRLCVLCFLCVLTPTGQAQVGVRIGVLNGGVYTVTTLPIETYVARVLAGEAAPNTAPAALGALAIAVRTYTAANLGRHRAAGFDLCDQTHCQVMQTANADTERSTQATTGLVLIDRGVPATIYYSASCGGRTEVPSAVWPGAVDTPHLPSRDDDACGGTPVWSAELAAADLQRALETGGFRGRLRNVRILSRHVSGRVDKLALEGMTPAEVSGQDLRMVVGPALGWRRILSTAFELRRIGDVYRFMGRGSGHGVGMCVIGSMRLAEAGETTEAILQRYYPGLTIGTFTAGVTPAASTSAALVAPTSPVPAARPVPSETAGRADIVVRLPAADEGERGSLTARVASARDDLARALNVSAPARIALTFHATADAYERSAAVPWFTSTAVVNGEAHFLPLAVLRDRGVLDRTIRRAIVHLLVASPLGGRPFWIREGVALYYADLSGAKADSPIGTRPCPDDLELQRPVSAGALSDAYTRARSCVARQIGSGRSWAEVR